MPPSPGPCHAGLAQIDETLIRKLRILALALNYRPLTGGTEVQAARLARVWAGQGHGVEIWTRRLDGSHPKEESEGDAQVRRLGWTTPSSARFLRTLEKLSFSISLLRGLITRRHQYDLVIAHQALYPSLIAGLARRVTGRPLVIRNASTGVTSDFRIWGRLTRQALAYLRSVADALVVTNLEGAREARACGFAESTIYRIPNGLHPGPAPPPRAVAPALRFAYIGGFRPEKRVDLLLRAWAKAGAPGELVLAGDGPLRSTLEALARELKISPVFLGNVSETTSLLRGIDVFVLPSDAEGMSNALLEAMAAGCACLATYVGGNIDCLAPECGAAPEAGVVVKSSAGWLVACGDEAALALALISLAKDQGARTRLGAEARARVVSTYDLEQTAATYLTLFQNLVSGGSVRAVAAGIESGEAKEIRPGKKT